jgi:outer membrane protein assembly factor BamB
VHVFDISTEFGSQAVPVKAISIGASVKSSFYAEDGLVYARGEDNWLYVVDIDRGAVSWTFDLGEEEE